MKLFYGWYIVVAAVVVGFLTTGLSGYANGILLPSLADTLADGSRGEISIGFSITTVMAAIIAPIAGRLGDKYSPRIILLIGACLIALAYVGIALSQNLWQFYLAKGIVFGIGITMAGPTIRSLIVARWFDSWRGRALGVSVLGASIAGVFLPLILNEMVTLLGWRNTVFVFAFAVTVLLIPTIWFVMKDRPEDIGEVRDGHAEASKKTTDIVSDRADDDKVLSWMEMIKQRSFWAAGLCFGPMTCVYIAISVHMFGHATNSGLSNEQAALVLSAIALASVIGKPIMGFLADTIGARATTWLSLALQGSALLLFTASSEFWHFLATASMHGLGYAAFSPMRTYVLSTSLGMGSLGSSVGLLKWIELPFGIVASPLAGFVYDATGSYDFAFTVFAGFIAVGAIGPFFFRDGRIKKVKIEPHDKAAPTLGG